MAVLLYSIILLMFALTQPALAVSALNVSANCDPDLNCHIKNDSNNIITYEANNPRIFCEGGIYNSTNVNHNYDFILPNEASKTIKINFPPSADVKWKDINVKKCQIGFYYNTVSQEKHELYKTKKEYWYPDGKHLFYVQLLPANKIGLNDYDESVLNITVNCKQRMIVA